MTDTAIRDATPATSEVASEPTLLSLTADRVLLERDLAQAALRLILAEIAGVKLKGQTLLNIKANAERGLGS